MKFAALSTGAQGAFVRRGIGKVEIENFRAFRGNHQFDFQAKNVLVYGENGSGKTSLWSSLEEMFAASIAETPEISRALFAKHRYQWAAAEDLAFVKLEIFSQGEFEWSDEATPREPKVARHDLFIATARNRACLDYRALWETYFLHRKVNQVDMWPLLIERLMNHVRSSVSGDTFGDLWFVVNEYKLSTRISHERREEQRNILSEKLKSFALEFALELGNIKQLALSILEVLSPGLTFDWSMIAPQLVQNARDKKWEIKQPQVIMTVLLNGQKLDNYHNLLNEARLSALALSIYLAAAKINLSKLSSNLGILALDDVLIGLDMSNRMPVLDVLNQFFGDWQIFLFTYDKVWFDLASEALDKERWKNFEFYASDDVPIVLDGKTLLEKSRWYLEADAQSQRAPDFRAAGVYARSAFEVMLKRFYKTNKLPLVYKPDGHYELGELWPNLKQLEKDGADDTRVPLIQSKLWDKVESAKKRHYNPLCHSQSVNYQKAEVESALSILEELEKTLEDASKVRHKVATGEIVFADCHEKKLKAVFYQAKKEMESRGLLPPQT